MADGDGQRIGGVIGPRDSLQLQQPPGHIHDLPLLRQAVAYHRLLDLHGGIFVYRQVHFLRRVQQYPPPVGHGNTGGDVLAEKQLLDGHLIWLELPDQLLQIASDLHQPGCQRHTRRGGNGSVPDHPLPPALGIDDAEAHGGHSRINAQNTHSRSFPFTRRGYKISLL